MYLPAYSILAISGSHSVYRFISQGTNGDITKLIIFSEFSPDECIYNLALVDVLSDGKTSDTNLSNNGDIRKIIATVAQALMDYTMVFPERIIFFQGSDEAGRRISIYNAAIKKYYYILEKDFYIEGIINDFNKEKYNPAKLYKSFLVKRK